MVLDPLSAFAVACNVLQIVEIGCKVLSSASDYRRSDDGSLTQHKELREISRTVTNLSSGLQSSLGNVSQSQQLSSEEVRLVEANDECLRLAKDFLAFLDQLKVKDRNSTWESIRMSIKARWYKDRVEPMQKALSDARDNLNIAFLIYMHSQQRVATVQTNDSIFDSTAQIEQTILAAVKSSSGSVQGEIRKLAEQLKETYLDSDEQTASGFLSSHQSALEEIASQLKVIGSSQGQLESQAAEDRRLAAAQKILESLYFNQMYDRKDQIREAYPSTYQWMLDPTLHDWQQWDNFSAWLNSRDTRQRIYWIHGKPGSGKSTMMKFLGNCLSVRTYIPEWAGERPVLNARCFFWAPGSTVQKSLQGLYRSILYQLLENSPDMIAEIVSARRWTSAQLVTSGDMLAAWSIQELRQSLIDLVQLLQARFNVLILIDGLDEFEGDDEEQGDLLVCLHDLSHFEHVKVCVSSRFWNTFVDAFRDCPGLRLEDFTYRDIGEYVRGRLQSSSRFVFFQKHQSEKSRALITAITNKAAGVFLWVRLVTNELLNGLRDGDGLDHLLRKLNHMPADLDHYFTRIFDSIEPRHRRETSVLLQLALFQEDEYTSIVPLTLMDISFMEEVQPMFVTSPVRYLNGFDIHNAESVQFFVDSTIRKLNSRCMGLLECADRKASWFDDYEEIRRSQQLMLQEFPIDTALRSEDEPESSRKVHMGYWELWNTEIVLLHRSLQDFLKQPRMQQILHQYTNGPLDARVFLCSARAAQCITLINAGSTYDLAVGLASHVLSSLSVLRDTQYCAIVADSICRTTEVLAEQAPATSSKSWYIRSSLENWKKEESNFLSLAIDFRLTTYVLPRLTSQTIKNKTGRPLLDYILRPRFADGDLLYADDNFQPCISILVTALASGADPNETYTAASASPWALFLCSIREDYRELEDYQPDSDQPVQYIAALKLLIEAGAAPVLPHLSLAGYTDPDSIHLNGKGSRYGTSHTRFLQRWPRAQPIQDARNESEYDQLYAVSDILEHLKVQLGPRIEFLIEVLRSKEAEYLQRSRRSINIDTPDRPQY